MTAVGVIIAIEVIAMDACGRVLGVMSFGVMLVLTTVRPVTNVFASLVLNRVFDAMTPDVINV